MANEVLVGLRIGAAVNSTLQSAFGSARSTVQQLGRATDGLTTKQQQMGRILSASIARGGSDIGQLRRRYDEVGRSIEQIRRKQEQLNTSIARGKTLEERRASLRGEFKETAGTAAAVAAPLVLSLRQAINFEDQLRDIRITAGFDDAEEQRLGNMLRGVALSKNQTTADLTLGAGALVAGGIGDLSELEMYVPAMAEVATATGASMEDLAASTIALRDSMKITGEDYKAVMNMLAAGGKAGQFELPDLAKWLPNLSAQYGAAGQTGKLAVAELTAALQVARMGAGNSDEAANNFKNFLAKLTSSDTIASFEKAGIDLQDAMKHMAEKGYSPVESMLNIVEKYLGRSGPEAAEKYRDALELTDEQQRQAALARLDESYKLGELFRDQQVLAFLRPALAHRGKMTNIEKVAVGSAEQDVIGQDFTLRMATSGSSLKAFGIGVSELALSVGNALLPSVNELLKQVIPTVQAFAAWAAENPGLIKGVVTVVGSLLAAKLAFIGVQYGINLVLWPMNAIGTTVKMLSAKWTLMTTIWRYSSPVLGRLAIGIKLAGQAVLWLGRALMANPLGLIIAGIALAAYLIYRYWEPIKAFFIGIWSEVKTAFNGGIGGILRLIADFSPIGLFYRAFAKVLGYFGIELPGKFSELAGGWLSSLVSGFTSMFPNFTGAVRSLWTEIRTGFDGGIGGIAQLITNFSPLGLLYKAFAGVMNYLGIELPASFTSFGGMILDGLVSGFTSRIGALRDSVIGIGTSIKGWFTGDMKIRSPSRVFIGYGENISEGAALGIRARAGLVGQAAESMARASAVPLAPPNLAGMSQAQARLGMSSSPMTVNFNPTIQIQGGDRSIEAQVGDALQKGYSEFVRNMQRFQQQNARLSYGGRD